MPLGQVEVQAGHKGGMRQEPHPPLGAFFYSLVVLLVRGIG